MHAFPRRLRSLATTLAVASVALVAIPSPASAATGARSADAFVDSIGVNTHTYYSDTVYYSRFDAVKRRLAELGVRHIRENLVPDRPDQYERLNELAAIGARPTLIVGDPSEGRAGLQALVSILADELRGTVVAAEGPNEYDTHGGADWLPRLSEYQSWLYDAIKGNPALAGMPVVGPSVVYARNQRALGDVSAKLDFGNIHSYPDGYGPESNLDDHLERAAHNSPGKPIMATETGYHTALGWHGEHHPTSEAASAVYLPRMFMEYFRRGIARTFSYELLDEGSGGDEREDSFGLLRNDFSEKPAFTALRNLIDILEDRGPAFRPGSLGYALDGESGDVHHQLLQKRDGTFYLALWRAAEVWDPRARSGRGAAARTVSVALDRAVHGASLYRPNSSSAPVASPTLADGALTVEVGPELTLLALDVGAPAGRIGLWVNRRTVPAGGKVAVRARLPKQAAGRPSRVTIQHLRGSTWRTVGHGRSTRKGVFRKALRLSPARFGRQPKLRVIASSAQPSRTVRVRIRKGGAKTAAAGISKAYAAAPAPSSN